MSAKYIFRLDDISWDMNYHNFKRIMEIFLKYDIKPLLGVIPHNVDENLKQQAGNERLSFSDFWDLISGLQNEHKCDIAIHGYEHKYVNENGGLLKWNQLSEFAGLPYDEQYEKLKKAIDIFDCHGIRYTSFMAPAHSFDEVTLKALNDCGIKFLTDGLSAFPYKKSDVWLIPAQWAIPTKKLYGYHTFCFHINGWQDKHFLRLERFIESNLKSCIGFSDVMTDIQNNRVSKSAVVVNISRIAILCEKKCFKIAIGILKR